MLRRHWTRKITATAFAMVLLGLLAPLVISLNFWHARIATALSRSLGRPVRTGAIHLKLFGGVGFQIENVSIGEDPRFGIEPFIRTETLRATLRLRSLLQRKMRFSSLVLVNPSLNVVRNAEGQWNLESLTTLLKQDAISGVPPAPDAAGAMPQQLPVIRIEAGRINFKSGDYKKAYVIDPLGMEIAPPSSVNDPWKISFEARPNRTDMPFDRDTRFKGEAQIGPFAHGFQTDAGSLARIELIGDNLMLGDWLKAVTGNDHGVHGMVKLHLRLAGTTSLLRVSGSADLNELHRWDLLPPPTASPLRAEIAAILDVQKDLLDVQSFSIPFSEGSIIVQGQIESMLHHPRPELQGQLHAVPLGSLVEIAKQFTTRLDSRFTAQGNVEGRLQMEGTPEAFAGSLSVTEGQVQEIGTPQVAKLSNLKVVLEGGKGHAGPVRISFDEGGALDSAAEWDIANRQITMHLLGDSVRLPALLPWARSLGSRWGQANVTRGNAVIRVDIASTQDKPSDITGWAQLTGASINSAAVNEPIRVSTALLQFQPGIVRVKPFSAQIGPLQLRGSLLAKLPLPAPQQAAQPAAVEFEFDVQSPEVDIAEIDRLLNPRYRPTPFFSLTGGDQNARFFGYLAAEGVFQAGSISYGKSEIRNFKASLDFHHRVLQVRNFTGEFASGIQNGEASISFTAGPPAFSIQTRFAGVDLAQLTRDISAWSGTFSGKLGGILRLAGSGWNLDEVLESLGGSGEASGVNLKIKGIDLTRRTEGKPDEVTEAASLSSKFQINKKEIRFVDLRIAPATPPGSERRMTPLLVTGSVGFDRSLDVVVAERDRAQTHHWRGTISEPLVDEAAAVLRSNEPAIH